MAEPASTTPVVQEPIALVPRNVILTLWGIVRTMKGNNPLSFEEMSSLKETIESTPVVPYQRVVDLKDMLFPPSPPEVLQEVPAEENGEVEEDLYAG